MIWIVIALAIIGFVIIAIAPTNSTNNFHRTDTIDESGWDD